MHNLDETDARILHYLQQDATLKTRELAEKLHLSYTPVYERERRLEKEGVIMKYVALVDREKIGKKLMAFCNIALKEHSKVMGEKFVKAVVAMPEVMECFNISGDYDFLLKIIVEDMSQYQQFLMQKLGSLDNIGSTHSLFVMGELRTPLNWNSRYRKNKYGTEKSDTVFQLTPNKNPCIQIKSQDLNFDMKSISLPFI